MISQLYKTVWGLVPDAKHTKIFVFKMQNKRDIGWEMPGKSPSMSE